MKECIQPKFGGVLIEHTRAASLTQLKELIGATKLKLDEAPMELLNRASDSRT